MKKCHKCGSELADDARFCLECGTECRTMEVKRKPKSGPETGEAGPLVGDKNLINESTIIGKQEKYEASNITLHNTINEDQSRKIVECAVSGKRIYMAVRIISGQTSVIQPKYPFKMKCRSEILFNLHLVQLTVTVRRQQAFRSGK